MKKILGAIGLSLALLISAQFGLAASDEEKVLTQLAEVEKEVKDLRDAIASRMAAGEKTSPAFMSEAITMSESFAERLKRLRRMRMDQE